LVHHSTQVFSNAHENQQMCVVEPGVALQQLEVVLMGNFVEPLMHSLSHLTGQHQATALGGESDVVIGIGAVFEELVKVQLFVHAVSPLVCLA
jgi:hypothetical protein